MDKSSEETKKMNAKSRQPKSAQPGSPYTDMNESAHQQARQENMKSANSATNFATNPATSSATNFATNPATSSATNFATNPATSSATNSIMPSSSSGMPGDPTLDEVKKANEKSRQNKEK